MNPNRNRLIFMTLILMGIGFVALVRSTVDEYVLSIINFVGINIVLAVSLNITNGFTGLFSLGHPGFMAIGGYVTAFLTFPVARKSMFLELPPWLANLELPFFPALLIGGVCAGLTGLLVGLPVLRLRGHYLAVATLGFLIIVQVLITNWESVTRGPLGLNGLPAFTNLWWVYPWVVLTVYVSWKLKFSSYGRSMISIREDDTAAQCLGVNLFQTRVVALVVGAFFAGVAGGLWAHLVTAITPTSFSLIMAFHIVVMVVVGGTGSITGAFIGAVIFSVLTEIFRPLEESLDAYGIGEVLMALILILILIFRPQGLFGSREPGFLSVRDRS
ncbi:MAG: branched-chain amino acid ABC transporter permease [Deltaproteobacteria bacterium]|jgi:branched-chain amino acid transport system permease protein|nr:branched-chain amino acid ABC transporter permease [Deltaproteobacteria bacterium]MBW2486324.1 branched-chain amino acid ABC transporter permease [Deltaproteobacteria bacterium]MBW2515254.1 branched-chain amino acid ABC transporter permease [Deltaproteobacteria bacterium]